MQSPHFRVPADAGVAAQEPILEGKEGFGKTGFYSAVPHRDGAGVRLPDIGAGQCVPEWMME
jgi:hypothetical protein